MRPALGLALLTLEQRRQIIVHGAMARMPGSMQDNPALTMTVYRFARVGLGRIQRWLERAMKLDLQYLDHPCGGERLVILPETQYRILALAAADALKAIGRQQPLAPSPADGIVAGNLRR